MTYHVGIGTGLKALGLEPCEPHLTCDEWDCSAVASCYTARGYVAAWVLKRGAAPKGWHRELHGEGGSTDLCPLHAPKRVRRKK